jgi:GT2 family glycosyltransferase
MNPVGIAIVTFNSERYIGACLDAALASGAEVVVVDNGSADGTSAEVRERPAARLIENGFNAGFAGGVNQAIRALPSPLVLLLNPDAVLRSPLDDLVAACSAPGVGAAGGRLIDESGATETGFVVRRFPTPLALAFEVLGVNRLWRGNPVNRRYRCFNLDHSQPADVEQPAGAFLMLRRDVWDRLGGLDERFFPFWFEDVDFCRRVAAAGLRIRYAPGAVASHAGGHSVRQAPWDVRKSAWNANLMRYARKHFGPLGARAVCAAVAAGCLLRLVPELLARRSPSTLKTHAAILRQAAAGFLLGR